MLENSTLNIWQMFLKNIMRYPKTWEAKKIAGIDLQWNYAANHHDQKISLVNLKLHFQAVYQGGAPNAKQTAITPPTYSTKSNMASRPR